VWRGALGAQGIYRVVRQPFVHDNYRLLKESFYLDARISNPISFMTEDVMSVLPGMLNSTDICYLCGESVSNPIDRDHVPPHQLYADEIRKQH
jgi:hypothetical protein